MTIAVLGASGTLGRIIRKVWGEEGVRYVGRRPDVAGCQAVLDLRGMVNGRGDVYDNISIARTALDAAADAGAGHVFLPSSAAVYGESSGVQTEDMSAPCSDYGHAKLEMERMAAEHPHPSTCLRIGNVAGADAILGGWRPGFSLDQLPDGSTPARSYIGPTCMARVLRDLMGLKDLPPVLNLAAPCVVEMGSLLDFADLPWKTRPATPQTIPRVELSTARLESLVRFAPKDRTPEGIVADWRAMKDDK